MKQPVLSNSVWLATTLAIALTSSPAIGACPDSLTKGCWETISVCPSSDQDCAQQGNSGWPHNLQAVHAILARTGKVLVYRQTQSGGGRGAVLWDPNTRKGTTYSTAGNHDLFCSGHAVSDTGTIYVNGGTDTTRCAAPNQNQPNGLNTMYVFDPGSPGWTQKASMSAGRWYPTVTVLPSGKILMTSGVDCTVDATTPEVYERVGDSFTSLSSASSSRMSSPWYPFVHVLKDGKVLHAGPHLASSTPPAAMQKLKPASGESWQNFGTSGVRGGSSVMYRVGSLATGAQARFFKTGGLLLGSDSTLTDKAEIVLEDGTKSAQAVMSHKREDHILTVLADGAVFISGGAKASKQVLANAVLATQIWNPADSSYTTTADSPTDRMYHGTALLLPDGRVLSAGGEYCPDVECSNTTKNFNADFYSPPYLYQGARPTVSSATVPAVVATGSSFKVRVTPNQGSISKVAFIRPGAVTHAFNQEQRYITLSFTSLSNDTLKITAPNATEESPPGYYMLNFVNGNGVPSVGEFVRVWGIVQSTVAHSNVQSLEDSIKVTISWETSNAAPSASNQVLFYDSQTSTTAIHAVRSTRSTTNNGRSHSVTCWITPCNTDYFWYEVKSSAASTTAKSLRTSTTKLKILYCVEP